MQVDLVDLRAENRMLKTPRVPQITSAPRQAAFTTTKVPQFDGTTSWEQYKQVFDAIVSSNGWDNDTAALQLFSHLEGDALNVALLVPLPRRLSRTGLVGALSAHYGSPGRLADYRRQFEKTTRTAGEDPSIFATALETLAIKAFGDMGQTARLRLVRDRFIAGHNSCELRRHWDSVLRRPHYGTWWIGAAFGRAMLTRRFVGLINLVRIRHIRPMWWETRDSISETTQVAAITRPRSGPDQLEGLTPKVIVGHGSPGSHTGSCYSA